MMCSNCGNKPVMFLLDFDDSGHFAELAAAHTEGEAIYLTSGKCLSEKTAIVLCDTPGKIDRAPGFGPELHYAIYSTMFHRSLFQLIVFTSDNPTLAEIPGLLNSKYPFAVGFKAELVSSRSVCETMRLRDFFGGSVDPNALLGILSVRPEGGFIDDVDYFMSDEQRRAFFVETNTFVQVEVNADGETRVASCGGFRSTDPVHKAVRLHIDCGPSPYKPLKNRFSDDLVLDTTLEIVLADGFHPNPSEEHPESREADQSGGNSADGTWQSGSVCAKCRLLTEENCKIISGIWKFIRRENGADWRTGQELHELAPYLHLRTLEGWCKAIRAAQESLNRDYPNGFSW
jgi:hypothetical protein